ncbi:hypothetical protein GCM10028895_49390 [Pontibacter rugosus]
MKLKNKSSYYTRKVHRYLGILLGVQFLFWTLGGLYFSWNDIENVHGDHLRRDKTYFPATVRLVSPQQALGELQSATQVDSIHSLQLIDLPGSPAYQIRYFAGESASHSEQEDDSHSTGHSSVKVQLANAVTGQLLAPLGRADAVRVAKKPL